MAGVTVPGRLGVGLGENLGPIVVNEFSEVIAIVENLSFALFLSPDYM